MGFQVMDGNMEKRGVDVAEGSLRFVMEDEDGLEELRLRHCHRRQQHELMLRTAQRQLLAAQHHFLQQINAQRTDVVDTEHVEHTRQQRERHIGEERHLVELQQLGGNERWPRARRRLLRTSDSTDDSDNNATTTTNVTISDNRVKHIQRVQLGNTDMPAWFWSPYPGEYGKCARLYVCEWCLKYMRCAEAHGRHRGRCTARGPQGALIYTKDNMAIYEACGREHKFYCQKLCLLAKLFLEQKTLFYDIERFLFYILCVVDEVGAHIVGCFSKEKQSQDGYNVACILTLPPYHRRGYGRLLISFSYELSKLEGTTGTPEKPLSPMGLLAYRSYWEDTVLRLLHTCGGTITLAEMCQRTGMARADVVATMHQLGLVQHWHGQRTLVLRPTHIAGLTQKRPRLVLDMATLKWTPTMPQREQSGP